METVLPPTPKIQSIILARIKPNLSGSSLTESSCVEPILHDDVTYRIGIHNRPHKHNSADSYLEP